MILPFHYILFWLLHQIDLLFFLCLFLFILYSLWYKGLLLFCRLASDVEFHGSVLVSLYHFWGSFFSFPLYESKCFFLPKKFSFSFSSLFFSFLSFDFFFLFYLIFSFFFHGIPRIYLLPSLLIFSLQMMTMIITWSFFCSEI